MLKQFINYFNLDKPYQFDITDITAPIYTICVIGILLGFNMNVLFFFGSLLATVFCVQTRRLNLVLLNGALFVLNAYNVMMMFI